MALIRIDSRKKLRASAQRYRRFRKIQVLTSLTRIELNDYISENWDGSCAFDSFS